MTRAQRRDHPAGLRNHELQRVVDRARVREPGQSIGQRATLGEREVAEVPQGRGSLADSVENKPSFGLAERRVVLDQHRTDHLATDERRYAHRAPQTVADAAGEQSLLVRDADVLAPEPNRKTRAWLRVQQTLGQHGARLNRRAGLEPIVAVVPAHHRDAARMKRALDLPLDELVRVPLGLGHLQDLGELPLLVAVLAVQA